MKFLSDFDKNINSLKSTHSQEASGFLASHCEWNLSQSTNSLLNLPLPQFFIFFTVVSQLVWVVMSSIEGLLQIEEEDKGIKVYLQASFMDVQGAL